LRDGGGGDTSGRGRLSEGEKAGNTIMDIGRDVAADHQDQDTESGAARESTAHRTPFVIRLGY
jgi:hypothetical protein